MSSSPDDPEERVLGTPPPPRPGKRSHADYIEQARSEETRLFWEQDLQLARESRLGSPGQFIAYYTDAQAVLDHILPEGRLRLSAFDRMRDPRENKDWVTFVTGGYQYGTAASLEDVAQALDRPPPFDSSAALRDANYARQRRTKILCLTGEPDSRSPDEDYRRCYTRPRMWEQYGEGHRGACLVFDKDELHATLLPQLHALGEVWHGRVKYDNAAIQGAMTTAFLLDGNRIVAALGDMNVAVAAHFHDHSDLLFFTKMEDHSDEQETRYVVYDGSEDAYAFVDIRTSLRAVVLGEQFDDVRLGDAIDVCAAARVSLRRIDWSSPYGPIVPRP